MENPMEQKLKEFTRALKNEYKVWRLHLDTFYSMEQDTQEKQEMLQTLKFTFYPDDSFNEFLRSVIGEHIWDTYKDRTLYNQFKIDNERTTKIIISKLLNHLISKGVSTQQFIYSASQYKYVCIQEAQNNFNTDN
jgi:hypothetical protein